MLCKPLFFFSFVWMARSYTLHPITAIYDVHPILTKNHKAVAEVATHSKNTFNSVLAWLSMNECNWRHSQKAAKLPECHVKETTNTDKKTDKVKIVFEFSAVKIILGYNQVSISNCCMVAVKSPEVDFHSPIRAWMSASSKMSPLNSRATGEAQLEQSRPHNEAISTAEARLTQLDCADHAAPLPIASWLPVNKQDEALAATVRLQDFNTSVISEVSIQM